MSEMASSLLAENAKKPNDFLFGQMPVLRVGLSEGREAIEFKSSGRFSVLDQTGRVLMRDVTTPLKWRVKIERSCPAAFSYSLLMGKFNEMTEAQNLLCQLMEKGNVASVQIIGGKLFLGQELINDNTQYWVLVNNFSNEEEAQAYSRENLPEYEPEIIKEKIRDSEAIIEILDSEFERLIETENMLRLVPESNEVVTYLFDISMDNGFQLKQSKYRAFRGVLEFRSNDMGKLAVLCELPLENYIEGVLSLEMKSEFPLEALKAQAVAVRSKTLAGLGIKHYNDPYDLCASSHCQIFTGLSRTTESIGKAVKETRGQVLSYENRIYDTDYTLICGGHTENLQEISNEQAQSYHYTAVYDTDKKELHKYDDNLTEEDKVRGWINSYPKVYCNLRGKANFQALNHVRKYFRWEVSYARKELEEVIREKTGEDVGTIYDIIPLKRGVSGRLTELEILGSRKNLRLKGEFNIRKVLSKNLLSSSCFYVEKEIGEDGIPLGFDLLGAGVGHGVGLCQTGAVVMAQMGFDYKTILSHYFKDSSLKSIYK